MSLPCLTGSTTFFLGMLGLTLHRKHLISALLCLEGMMLALFSLLSLILQTTHHMTTSLHPLILLTLAACGAGTGLALVVATTRTHATSQLKNLNLLKC
uniref:NADH-ubiquinone oxidoreductase chain 4L n=1 Tax=Pachydactylus punctatus TaxID=185352 RepID=A0A7R7G1P9_9SAUR|nr:NADH dehydrogenase subunit 4L [Pachydactylus punctatus]